MVWTPTGFHSNGEFVMKRYWSISKAFLIVAMIGIIWVGVGEPTEPSFSKIVFYVT